ncbi:NifU family protein [Nocardioides sp.]|uniref:NifU family protein n=1 Tax=Nocardioides sp. TaxID=35761 RepID=UPI0035168473
MSTTVPIHAEAVPGDPTTVRWVVPAGRLGFVGSPAVVPAPLAGLLDDGVVSQLEVEPAAVLVTLAPPHVWAVEGDRVRTALQTALADPAGWRAPAGVTAADRLAAAARQVLAGEVGDYARSHGGRLELVAVHDGEVEIALHGTCDGCPAAGRTLEDRVLTALRRLDPSVRRVVSAAPPEPAPGRRRLPLRPR